MNKMIGLFVFGLMVGLISQAMQTPEVHRFETIDTLHAQAIDEALVHENLAGHVWLENRFTTQVKDLNQIYQERLSERSLENNSQVKRYPGAYTWIEERTCPGSPEMRKPVRALMTSRFGRRVHPMTGHSHVHAGIDFRGRTGTPVMASAPGIVKSAARKGAYGKAIVIDHGNSFTTLYAHLSGYSIKAGDWVNQGQTIGFIGRTGRVTGPHLHFEVRCHNVPLNPTKYLGKQGLLAGVKFKRRSRHRHHHHSGHHVARKTASLPVVKDANYYTRLINQQKLQKLNKGKMRSNAGGNQKSLLSP